MKDKYFKSVEKEVPEAVNEAETVSAPAIVNPTETEPEYWEYMGCDSTALTEVNIVSIKDDGQKLIEKWMVKGKKPKKGQIVNNDAVIEEGVELIREISGEANKLINIANKNFADRAIQIGLICHRLKELIRGNKQLWAVWAEENLPFIAKRNREKYMMLASRPDCWPFSFLGVDRMEMLCSVTKEMSGDNPIGDLLRNYSIPFDEGTEINMSEFKALIDAAISQEHLINNGVTINFNLVTNIVNLGVDFDKSMIKRLKDIQDCGGNPENLLKRLALTGGKEEVESSPEKRLQDFNYLSNRLIKTLDFIMSDQNQLAKIDKDSFSLLVAKLLNIQELGILNDKENAD